MQRERYRRTAEEERKLKNVIRERFAEEERKLNNVCLTVIDICRIRRARKRYGETTDAKKKEALSSSTSTDEKDVASASEKELSKEKAELLVSQWDATFVFVTNEIGSGLHATTSASRKFVDAQGWFNQHVASNADAVVHMVAGVPNFVKRPSSSSSSSGGRDPTKAPCDKDLEERTMLDKFLSASKLNMDKKGYFMVKVDHDRELCAPRTTRA